MENLLAYTFDKADPTFEEIESAKNEMALKLMESKTNPEFNAIHWTPSKSIDGHFRIIGEWVVAPLPTQLKI